jgi:RNA polymerase sigma factor (sigma-70 family)
MDRLLLEDPAAVAAMAAGNPAGLESVYRRYADRIYAYAKSIVGDDDTAADVIQETFLLAQQRVRQLRDPERVGSWLYAIARNECLAKLRARKRTVMLAQSHEPVLDTDPGRAVHAEQVRELVHAAAAGMNEGDREVFELTVRHGLPATDVARVLDISDKHAHARISRARSQFEGALGALVLARDGRGRCEQLDAIMQGWDGQLTALLRKRIERHSRDCDVCSQRRRERMNPAGLLASYATLPFLAVAAQLWPRLKLVSTGSSSGAATATAGASPGDPSVSPIGAGPPVSPIGGAPPAGPGGTLVMPTVPRPPAKRSNRGVVLGAAAAVLLIILGVSAVRLLTLDRGTTPAAAPSASTVSETTTPSATLEPTPTPSVEPTSAAPEPPPPPPPFTVSADGELCAVPPNQLIVTATATVPLSQAVIFYQQPPGSATKNRAMSVSGSTAEIEFSDWSFAPEVRWWVEAQSTDDRTFTTPEVLTTFAPC